MKEYKHITIITYLFFISFCFTNNIMSENASELFHNSWAKAYGGSSSEYIRSIQKTNDGGFIVVGYTNTYGAGNYDIWALKLDSAGAVQWQNAYGASGTEYAYSIQQTNDDGYIIAGSTTSYGTGGEDALIIKLNSNGSIQTAAIYGDEASGIDTIYDIKQTSDGGYIVAGRTNSYGAGNYDYWVLKLNSAGGSDWQETYGGSASDIAYSIQQTSDGGYIIAGVSYSFGVENGDVWVLKLNNAGIIQWQKAYGGTAIDRAYSIKQTADGGYIIAGDTQSFGAGAFDAWVIKINSSGDIQWQRAYGGEYGDSANAIQQTDDGSYILGASTYSYGNGQSDVWVLKLTSNGSILWQKTYGGSNID